MKIATWDSSEFTWDNPNLYWGDPSYLLEPGDPGYVPQPGDASPQPTPKPQKKRKMPKSDYISQNDDAFVAQLLTFKDNIASYAALLGVSATQVTAQAADADYLGFVVACQKSIQNGAQQWTSWKKITRGGGVAPVGGIPVVPVYPEAVDPVTPGVEVRFRALVKQIKANANYNEAIGQALGIEGAEQSAPDLGSVQPELRLESSGGVVNVRWGWQGNADHLDMIEIEVDRGTGAFNLLTFDTTPDYNDTTPPPATAARWKYRGIYRVGDARVGQWSNEVGITVGG